MKRLEFSDGRVESSPRGSKKEKGISLNKSKINSLGKELEKEKAMNAMLRDEIQKLREEKKDMATIFTDELNTMRFERNLGPCSTRREVQLNYGDESKFMSSISQLAISSINIPECKPAAEDGEIHRNTFETWKNLLVDSMDLAGVDEESTKFSIFKVKAGIRLLEIFKSTKSDIDAPDPHSKPFSNALHRLKTYFGSSSDIMLQRRKLAVMLQKSDESDLAFINRVGAVARVCDFGVEKEFEEIVSTVAERARNKEVRAAALKMLGRKGSYSDLVDKVREIEAIQINENFVMLRTGMNFSSPVATVSADHPARNPGDNNFKQYRGSNEKVQNWRGEHYGQKHNARGFFSGNSGNRSWGNKTRVNKCWRCHSTFHLPFECEAANKTCRACGKLGHLQRACRLSVQSATKTSMKRSPETYTRCPESDVKKMKISSIDSEKASLFSEKKVKNIEDALMVNAMEFIDCGVIAAEVAGMSCQFLIDSGAQVNTLTKTSFDRLIREEKYMKGVYNRQDKADRSLKAYASSGEIEVVATFEAYLYITEDRPVFLEKFYVVKEARSLLGRATAFRYSVLWLGLEVPVGIGNNFDSSIMSIKDQAIAPISSPFPKFNIPPIKINYDNSRPPCRNIFMNIPHAVKSTVEHRLKELVNLEIIEEVQGDMNTEFCSSMLVVPKGKCDIRLVIDLRGPNKYIYRSPFSMPTLEKILAELNGAQWFSSIDLCNAYFHIELDLESRHLTNFCTEFGMFRFRRLPFGLCNAPDIFQETLQRNILRDCNGVKNYLDDILVYGKTKIEHDENLKAVMARLSEHNVKLNMEKCVFGKQAVKFLGFMITAEGWKVEDDKVRAIQQFRRPSCCSEVKSFLGLITFIDKFIVHRATKTENLRRLANADEFVWTEKEETEFRFLQSKALKTINNLGYYSALDRTELYVDASPTGLGAVLVQFSEDNTARIIACASKALTQTEQKYPHTQKEALAVVWGVERFTYYLLSKFFTVRTDAEANLFIFDGCHRLGKRTISRAESWALRLQNYDFIMKKVPGDQNIADALSRLIHETQEANPFEDENESHLLYTLDAGIMEISWNEIEIEAENDGELRILRTALVNDEWPRDLRCYEAQKKNLNIIGYLIFKDDKIILPKSLRIKALTSAHGGHIGIVTMKRIMRQHFWWPNMSSETEIFVKNCRTCTLLSRKNPPLPISSRELPDGPWEILQIDFLSVPNCGSGEFLVVVDTYSRYLSVIEMNNTSADSTNKALCEIFMLWGCPLIIQSDNGPPFQSSSFTSFWENKGVKIRKSIPLNPRSNGTVERQNQGILKALSAAKIDGANWKSVLQNYTHHHNTLIPHSRLLVTPFELMVGWKYRGTFPSLYKSPDLNRSSIKDRDATSKLSSKTYEDFRHGAKEMDLKVGDNVLLAQPKKIKTDPTFSTDVYKVVAREGAKVVIVNRNGVQYTRNASDLKKVMESLGEDKLDSMLSNDSECPAECQERINMNPEGLQHRRKIRKPARYDDQFIYNIFD